MNKRLLTLCFVCRGEQILLGMKKRGFGEGLWNGFGGKVEPNETVEEAAKREMQEECGITPRAMEKKAILNFEFISSEEYLEVHVFKAADFFGEIKESEEMKPQWFSFGEIPYDNMWPDDRHWLPQFIAGKMLRGYFRFQDQSTLLSNQVEEVFEL